MSDITISDRLTKKIMLITQDAGIEQVIQTHLPEGWAMNVISSLDGLGDWNEVLLHRFVLLDLDEVDAFDPLDIIRTIRMKYMINIPVFCFGGDQDIQDEMRISRADRFFTREELPARLEGFFAALGW